MKKLPHLTLTEFADLFERIPVPERSGFKGAVLSVSFWLALLTAGGGGGGWCAIHFLSCKVQAAPEAMVLRWRPVARLHFGRGSTLRECTCHLDERYDDGTEHHDAGSAVACGALTETDWRSTNTPEAWQLGPWVFWDQLGYRDSRTGRVGFVAAVRLHCSDDPRYTPRFIYYPDRTQEGDE